MSSPESNKAVVAALSANIGIAATKFVAAAISGSASMLAEAIHSLADSGNQVLLIIGGRQSRKQATASHPFGYGRQRYIFAFMVAIVLFSVGGLFSVYEGVQKIYHPHLVENAWLPLVVLGVSIGLEALSLRTALGEVNKQRGSESLISFVRHAKAPELPVVVMEDIAALVGLVLAFAGVGLTVITHLAIFDAIGTICIGVLLVLVALILGSQTGSLLIGQGASQKDLNAIQQAFSECPGVLGLIHMKTLYLGPDELLLAAKIAVAENQSATEVADTINDAESLIRAAVPAARVIYLEPDIRRA